MRRSLRKTVSISPPLVDSTSAPSTARKRWMGTATDTMISLRSLTLTTLTEAPLREAVTSGKSLPLSKP